MSSLFGALAGPSRTESAEAAKPAESTRTRLDASAIGEEPSRPASRGPRSSAPNRPLAISAPPTGQSGSRDGADAQILHLQRPEARGHAALAEREAAAPETAGQRQASGRRRGRR